MTWDADTRRSRLREALELSRSYRRYGSEVAAALPTAAPSPAPVDQGAWYEQRTEVPAGSPSLVGDLAVPAAQALLSGGFASAAVAVARGAGLELAGWAIAGAGIAAAGVVWTVLLADGRKLLRSVVIESRGDAVPVAADLPHPRDVLSVTVREDRPGSGPQSVRRSRRARVTYPGGTWSASAGWGQTASGRSCQHWRRAGS